MKRKACIAVAAVAVAVLAFFGIRLLDSCGRADEDVETEVRPSEDLDRDKRRMWRLVELQTRDETGDVTYLVSPVSAINAASRVMATEKANLIGLTPKQVLQRLNHDEKHRKGSYNFPFFPLGEDEHAMVLRLDCGNFGWQFDLLLDDNGKVSEVRRRWIH